MATDLIRYDLLVQDALRAVMRKVLTDAAREGLPGEHHFFVTFKTRAPGVRLSNRMREQYPVEMTIVLQHQFWDLTVGDQAFEVGLSFHGKSETSAYSFRCGDGLFRPFGGIRPEVRTCKRRTAERRAGRSFAAGSGASAGAGARQGKAARKRQRTRRGGAGSGERRCRAREARKSRRAKTCGAGQGHFDRDISEEAVRNARPANGGQETSLSSVVGPPSAILRKHSLTIAGHRTSISLERAFWDALRRIAARRGSSVAALVAEIDAARGAANLCSAIRVHVLASCRQAADRDRQ